MKLTEVAQNIHDRFKILEVEQGSIRDIDRTSKRTTIKMSMNTLQQLFGEPIVNDTPRDDDTPPMEWVVRIRYVERDEPIEDYVHATAHIYSVDDTFQYWNVATRDQQSYAVVSQVLQNYIGT